MTYTLRVELEDLRIIAAGLNELPVKTGAAALLVRLQGQVTEQEQALTAQAEPPTKSQLRGLQPENEPTPTEEAPWPPPRPPRR